MSEEIENAAVNVPRAIFTTMILNGATGFAMVIAVLFCLGDIDSVIVSDLPYHTRTALTPAKNTPTGFPFIQAFYNGTGSYAGATVMAGLLAGLLWCAVIGFLATASRMTWSFARDRGVPFHRFISLVCEACCLYAYESNYSPVLSGRTAYSHPHGSHWRSYFDPGSPRSHLYRVFICV